jgi:hypothetical protein
MPDETLYRFNDRVYRSLDEMPPEIRALFERARALPPGSKLVSEKRVTRYVVNGREYRSIEEMPPDVRKPLENQDGNGEPDLLDAVKRDAGLHGEIVFGAGLSLTSGPAPSPPRVQSGAPPVRREPASPSKTPLITHTPRQRTGPALAIRATEIPLSILGLILGAFVCYLVLR